MEMRHRTLIALGLAGCALSPFDRTTPGEPGSGGGGGTAGANSPWGSPGPMYGDLHRLIFNITGFCDGVCPNRYVLLAGTRNNGAAVNLPPFDAPTARCRTFRIRSSDPAVAAVRAMNPSNGDRLCIAIGGADDMMVDALGGGDALLTVTDDAGQLFDRIEIHVRDAAGVLLWESARRDIAGNSVTLERTDKGPLAGEFGSFPIDAAGQRIVTAESTTYEIADPRIATFVDVWLGEVAKVASFDAAFVHPLTPGTTTLTLTFRGLQKSYALVVK
jgi:hypothetical protein